MAGIERLPWAQFWRQTATLDRARESEEKDSEKGSQGRCCAM